VYKISFIHSDGVKEHDNLLNLRGVDKRVCATVLPPVGVDHIIMLLRQWCCSLAMSNVFGFLGGFDFQDK